MPYQNHRGGFQHASPLGHVPTMRHPMVVETLQQFAMPATRTGSPDEITTLLRDPDTLDQPEGKVQWTIATDSSPLEEEVDPSFPSTRVLFMQIAAVIVNLDQLNERTGRFVDPVAIKQAQNAAVMSGVLPSSNLHHRDELPALVAFRRAVDNLFRSSEIEGGRTFLDMLIEIESVHPGLSANHLAMEHCSNLECDAKLDRRNPTKSGEHFVEVGIDGAVCPNCGADLLAVDILRSHATFSENGTNIETCNRILSVAERLAALALLANLQERMPSILGSTSFITDGPLALFGSVAPLKKSFLLWMQQMAAKQVANGFDLPVIVGIEKGGRFQEHAQAIRPVIDEVIAAAGDTRGRRLMILSDEYVQQYITFRGETHGLDTYYGRHFLYRSSTGAIYTITVPPLGATDVLPHHNFEEAHYPTLRATCDVLDRIGTRLYPDATIPVALAHEFAAYPLQNAGKVLKLHAEQHLATATSVT